MKYKVELMKREEAVEVSKWKYESPYSIYSMDESEECINEFINEKYYSLIDKDNNLIGYYCFGKAAQVPVGNKFGAYDDSRFIDIGLGMNPSMCGKGLGQGFLENGIEFGKKQLSVGNFRLTVASFNVRAIKVYKKIGFKEVMRFIRENNGDKVEFIVMVLE